MEFATYGMGSSADTGKHRFSVHDGSLMLHRACQLLAPFRRKATQWSPVHRTKTKLVSELFPACRTKLHRYYLFLALGEQYSHCRVGRCLYACPLPIITVCDSLIETFRRLWRNPALEQALKLIFRNKLLFGPFRLNGSAHLKPSPK